MKMTKKIIFILLLSISINAQTMEDLMEEKKSKLTDEEINQTTALILTLLKQKFSIALKE